MNSHEFEDEVSAGSLKLWPEEPLGNQGFGKQVSFDASILGPQVSHGNQAFEVVFVEYLAPYVVSENNHWVEVFAD